MRIKSALALIVALVATPAAPEEASGAYLAAQLARMDYDFAAAASYYNRALIKDPSNPVIMESAVVANLSLGEIKRAIPVARKIESDGLRSQAAYIALVADEVAREAYDDLLTRIAEGRGIGELADGLIIAWAHLGKGDMQAALAKFDEVAEQRGLRGFASYHKALALASVGDFEAADAIYADNSSGPIQRTRRGMVAWMQVLSQLERNDDAIARLDETFRGAQDPEIQQLRDRLVAGERLPFTVVGDAKAGIAEVFFTLGQALLSETGEDYVLLFSRVTEFLNPSHTDAIILSAELLENLDRYELATETYKRVPREDPSFHMAELGRAEALRRSEKTDAAIEVMNQLSESHANLPLVHVTVGDLYRQLDRFEESVASYDRAIDLYQEYDDERWFVYYVRGISHERIGVWEKAEADFRRALELNPGQPDVLNYLGYTMVEKKVNLDEALDMIERAVAKRPDSGYIVDSLGWVLYRLGRYDESIGYMERAAELVPVDPVINDHLGDVLWAVGRFTEARFQWKRALSFVDKDKPSPDVKPDRIRRKLEAGLDQVLQEEGLPPLKVAEDGG